MQAKTALEKGSGDGSFFLPATLATGNYTIRAYTNWMKNYGANYFFEKKITIINIQKESSQNTTSVKPLYDIGFFPEGGSLVAGIESKVGFKVNNQYGKGVEFSGALVSDKGDTVLHFQPYKFGMGNFNFKPAAGVQYRAIISLPGGEKQEKKLPVTGSNGYVMQLQHNNTGQLIINVLSAGEASNSAVYLFVHTRNVTKAVSSTSLQNGQASFTISDTIPGDGISQFTIFNSSRQPVCERLYFKKPQQNLVIKASPDEQVYGQRKPVNISINTTAQSGGRSTAADMSMAVYRMDSLAAEDEISISDYLLLSADLTGIIESPHYYFTTVNDATAADNLMLTQGWRRFNWDEVLQNKKPSFKFIPEIYGHIINGKITALNKNMPLVNVVTYLSVPGIRTQFQPANADSAGNIKFDMKDFYSDGDIVVQTNNETDSCYRIEIDQPFFSKFSGRQQDAFSYNPAGSNNTVSKRYTSTQIQNTYLYNRLNQPVELSIDTNAFYLKPDGRYLLDNYVRFTTLEEVMREYVIEVNVRRPGGKFILPVIDEGGKKPFTDPPLILLDGVPMFDTDKLMAYDPLKIKQLDVMSRKYFLRDNSFDGVINLTTYKGDLEGFEIDPRATIINYEGLQLQREFYSPVYATEKQQQSRLPDYRNLLFWTPILNTDANGKTQTSFYSSDVPGKYVGIIQGITPEGKTGEEKIYFEVK